VKAGRNVIAVRIVTAVSQHAGLLAKASKMGLPVPDPESVDGSWKMQIERKFPQLTKQALALQPKVNNSTLFGTASGIFNGMIQPILPYAIRGAIWYQGESNLSLDIAFYKTLFPTMISDWRARWGEGDFPFYFVQLANIESAHRNHGNSQWAVTREAQRLTLTAVPNVGMAVIIDIGEAHNIHPTNKQDVGARLALLARARTYDEKALVCQSPLYQSFKVEGNKIRVFFDTGGAPLMVGKKTGLAPTQETPGEKLDRFEIAGADSKFAWADAVIDGDCVVLSAAEVPKPVMACYAWASNPEGCNLYNKAGLPASPFRTDTK
jgi:sialate O-acetylesterase